MTQRQLNLVKFWLPIHIPFGENIELTITPTTIKIINIHGKTSPRKHMISFRRKEWLKMIRTIEQVYKENN